jgi:protein-S-isoprenylcysteine O-methyltransferase Ste14
MSQTAFTRLELKIPPPVVVGVGGLLNWFATRWADDLFAAPCLLIGALVTVSGVVGSAGVLACLHCQTTIHPWRPDETTVLVTQGVFRLSRNPMYLALLTLLLAYYLYQPIWLSPLIFLLITWYLRRFQVLPEERILSEKFGDQYAQYASAVRRWL